MPRGKSNAKWTYAYLHKGSRLPILKVISLKSATTETEDRGKVLAAKVAGVTVDQILCFPSKLEFDCFKLLVDKFGFDNVGRHVKLTLSEEYDLHWVIDFYVQLPTGQFLSVEAKGIETPEFKKQFKVYCRIRDRYPGRLPRLIVARSVKDLRQQLEAGDLVPVQTVLL